MTPAQVSKIHSVTDEVRAIPDADLDRMASATEWGQVLIDGAVKHRYLNDLDTEHLENILITQRHISFTLSRVILHILKKRYMEEFNQTLLSSTITSCERSKVVQRKS